jgi:hypothetical protein
MNIHNRLARLEESPELRDFEEERRSRRIMELIAIGTLRLRRLTVLSVAQLSESELLGIIGADKPRYVRALSGFIARRRREAHA